MTDILKNLETPLYNSAQFDLLLGFYRENPRSVLTPQILMNWNEIHRRSKEAWRYAFGFDEFGSLAGTYEPPPEILENILPPGDASRIPPAAAVWRQAEAFLYRMGFRARHIAIHDCGREAIVASIRNVPDLLLKVSCTSTVGSWNMPLNMPFGKFVIAPFPASPPSKVKAVALTLAPYLGGAVPQLSSQNGLDEIFLPFALRSDAPSQAVTEDGIERIFNAYGLTLVDRKKANIRWHNQYPGLTMVIDRRAIEELPADDSRRQVTLESGETDLYGALQEAIHEQLTVKYGLLCYMERQQALQAKAQRRGGLLSDAEMEKYLKEQVRSMPFDPFRGAALAARGKGWPAGADYRDMWETEDARYDEAFVPENWRRASSPKSCES